MPAWLARIVTAGLWRRLPWARVLLVAHWLWTHGRDRLERNLTARERGELARLLRKSKGRRANLSERERRRVTELLRRAVTGRG